MKQYSVSSIKVLGLLLAVLVALPVSAAEILVEQDFKQHIIKGEQLVRVADNALFLIDSSGSMNKKFQDTGQSRYDVVVSEFKARTSYFPEIGHKFGVYLYTPWTEIYPMQTFNREKFAEALESLPPKGKRVTPLHRGLDKADELLGTLQGRTALFLVTDGTYSRDDSDVMKPIEKAREMVKKHDVCFYVISAAKEKRNEKMLKNIAGLNSCSRLIPFANFIKYPDYRTGALFAVKATETVVTTMDTKVVGLEANNLRFKFNEADVQSKEMRELDEVGAFLQKNPSAYISIHGYTDDVGSAEYNLSLSLRRAEAAAAYLIDKFRIDANRIVRHWYGFANPIAKNDTEEGRAENRRVELAIGMVEGSENPG